MKITYKEYEGPYSTYRYGLCLCDRAFIESITGHKKGVAIFHNDVAYFSDTAVGVLAHESLHIAIKAIRKTVEDIDFNELLSGSVIGEEAFAHFFSNIFDAVLNWAKGINHAR